MKMKKFLASLLSAAMIFSAAGISVLAEDVTIELPAATVTELDVTEIEHAPELRFALNFIADTATDEQIAEYSDWYADFVFTLSKDAVFNKDGSADGYLAGQYDSFGRAWVAVPNDDYEYTAGTPLKIMATAAEIMGKKGLKYTYGEVYEVVKDFDCGVYLDDEYLIANPDLVITLELRMYNPENEEDSYAIGETYEFKATDLEKSTPEITVGEIAEVTYGDAAFDVDVDVVAGGSVTYESSNTDVAEIDENGTVTIKGAGETDITVKQAENVLYSAFTNTQTLIVNKKDVTVTSVNLDAKNAVLDGVLAEDTEVALDFDNLNLEITTAVDDTTSNVTVTNLVLVGDKAENYSLMTESLESTVTTENTVAVTVESTKNIVDVDTSYLSGSSVTITAPTARGYKFSGWYDGDTKVSGDASYTFTADSNIALTAKYTKTSSGSLSGGGGASVVTYTVNFNTDGGSAVSSVRVTSNAKAAEPTTPTKEGYTFAGWYIDSELTTAYDFATAVTKNTTLYAKWTENNTDSATEDTDNKQIILTIGEKTATVFGEEKTNDVAPKIVNERTMLPSRFVAESLGAKVIWTADEPDKVVITKGDVEIIITIGAETAVVNGEEITLDAPAFIENDRTYTPIRFISEKLGATVEWIPETQQVVIAAE
ncbi:MAG: InlB B-repeat-containing protein [Clostridia bacterium]|nr:InlB B-repeat-containing protein [Clostridia bacterium]